MTETPARFEYRAFAQGFGLVAERMRGRAEDGGRCRESRELYTPISSRRMDIWPTSCPTGPIR